jgi:hypothetical protein
VVKYPSNQKSLGLQESENKVKSEKDKEESKEASK